MTSINSCANRESWAGTYYELAVEVSPRLNDDALAGAIDALWSAPQLTGGPWPDESATRGVVRPALPEAGDMRSYYGLLAVPQLGTLRCVSWVIRGSEEGADWLDLCVPTATLEPRGLIHPVYDSPPWVLDALDRTFISVAARIYAKAPFSLALVGEEVSGLLSCESLTHEQCLSGRLLLSWRLLTRLQLETIAQPVTEDLFWVPPGGQSRT